MNDANLIHTRIWEEEPEPDNAFAARCIELGTTFTAVGVDAGILARGTEKLAQQFRKS